MQLPRRRRGGANSAARRSTRALACTAAWTVLLIGTLTACGNDSPSTLSPAGPKSQLIATIWWALFGISVLVSALVIGAMLWAAFFRRGDTKVNQTSGKGIVLTLGAVIPAAILIATFGTSVGGIARNADPPSPTEMTIEITGNRWWWEVRYPEAGVVTANEIHIPVDTPVRLRLETDDVIHSFWVPELMPKQDLLPKRINHVWMSADEPGVYRGQCAEYCGAQHAHMAFHVVAEPSNEFEVWLAEQSEPAEKPDTELEREGLDVLQTSTCGTCHTVRGTSADGELGPDLTHVGSRSWLAAGAIPNDFGHMSGWVANSQTVKPGNLMPPQQLSPEELRAVVTYLQSLE
ncbi:MAG TPA: cytochrome c oxidase subunit II [Nocardioidaceae bacterium]|nr:cytochrome c oxidase subunit II [Nocardioidaceae bacterium]